VDAVALNAMPFGPVDADLDLPRLEERVRQRNVRNVLQRRKMTGYLEWDGHGRYRFAP